MRLGEISFYDMSTAQTFLQEVPLMVRAAPIRVSCISYPRIVQFAYGSHEASFGQQEITGFGHDRLCREHRRSSPDTHHARKTRSVMVFSDRYGALVCRSDLHLRSPGQRLWSSAKSPVGSRSATASSICPEPTRPRSSIHSGTPHKKCRERFLNGRGVVVSLP